MRKLFLAVEQSAIYQNGLQAQHWVMQVFQKVRVLLIFLRVSSKLMHIQALAFHILKPEMHSYTPVAHSLLINMVKERLDKHNLSISRTRYDSNKNTSQMFGVYDLTTSDGETNLNIGFRNSYDKTLPVGLVAGGTVIVCSNLMFKGEIKVLRKHTRHVFKDLEVLTENVIQSALYQYEQIGEDKEKMKLKLLDNRQMAELAGRMFIEEKMLTANQMSELKREIYKSEHFHGSTLWDFYNHTTHALKKSHPGAIISNHIRAHNFVMELA